jgi:FtsP/CotA-like multicopper oxidase with cupredoxin domain
MDSWNLVRASAFLLAAIPYLGSVVPAQTTAPASGKIRTYYVAADEVDWDYAPSGRDEAMGHPFDELEKGYTEPGPHRIGRVYKKAVYREYEDPSFSKRKVRPLDQAYLGLLGPILRGEVGDTIKIVFKNNASHPFSMHPHGVLYQKDSEGADYNDGTASADKADGAVPPGATHTYVWQIPERAGPGPQDPSSVFWLYHSHADELQDVASGLFGVIVVTRRGMALPVRQPVHRDQRK